jgi:hypothetical protein
MYPLVAAQNSSGKKSDRDRRRMKTNSRRPKNTANISTGERRSQAHTFDSVGQPYFNLEQAKPKLSPLFPITDSVENRAPTRDTDVLCDGCGRRFSICYSRAKTAIVANCGCAPCRFEGSYTEADFRGLTLSSEHRAIRSRTGHSAKIERFSIDAALSNSAQNGKPLFWGPS